MNRFDYLDNFDGQVLFEESLETLIPKLQPYTNHQDPYSIMLDLIDYLLEQMRDDFHDNLNNCGCTAEDLAESIVDYAKILTRFTTAAANYRDA